jgi:hypothetical protein
MRKANGGVWNPKDKAILNWSVLFLGALGSGCGLIKWGVPDQQYAKEPCIAQLKDILEANLAINKVIGVQRRSSSFIRFGFGGETSERPGLTYRLDYSGNGRWMGKNSMSYVMTTSKKQWIRLCWYLDHVRGGIKQKEKRENDENSSC